MECRLQHPFTCMISGVTGSGEIDGFMDCTISLKRYIFPYNISNSVKKIHFFVTISNYKELLHSTSPPTSLTFIRWRKIRYCDKN